MSSPLVLQRIPIAVGRAVEAKSSHLVEFIDRPAHQPPRDGRYELERSVREEVLATTGTLVTRLAIEYHAWRETMTSGAVTSARDLLQGKRYVVESSPRGLQVADAAGAAVAGDERREVEFEYAMLGCDAVVFKVALRPFDVGDPAPSLGELVRALLYTHARGVRGYSPSLELSITAQLERCVTLPGGDGGAFAIHVEPRPDPALREHLWLDGELVLDAHARPLSFDVAGRMDQRVFTRTGEIATDGRVRLSVAWAFV